MAWPWRTNVIVSTTTTPSGVSNTPTFPPTPVKACTPSASRTSSSEPTTHQSAPPTTATAATTQTRTRRTSASRAATDETVAAHRARDRVAHLHPRVRHAPSSHALRARGNPVSRLPADGPQATERRARPALRDHRRRAARPRQHAHGDGRRARRRRDGRRGRALHARALPPG